MKLDNFTETRSPNNYPRYLKIDMDDEIIIGGTTTHIFKLNFKYTGFVKDCKIIYKQGFDVILEKVPTKDQIIEHGNKTTINLVLTPEETMLFKKVYRDTFVQIKIETVDGEVLYNDKNKLVIKQPLDQ